MDKPNFVISLGFGGNSNTLKGLTDYLAEFFTVNVIEVPGFGGDAKPLDDITVAGFSGYFEEKLKELNLDSYLLAGFSLGFRIVNGVPLDPRCKGIVAVEPFLNTHALRFSGPQRLWLYVPISLICRFRLYYAVWKMPIFRSMMNSMFHKSAVDIMLRECDPRTFFETGRIILTDKTKVEFGPLPYVVIAGKYDIYVNSDLVIGLFREHVKRLLVLQSDTEHYPANMDKEYFRTHFPAEGLLRLIEFIKEENA